MATSEARRPTTRPLASITTHFFVTSAGFAEKVFMMMCPEKENRRTRRAPNWALSREGIVSRQRQISMFYINKTIAYNYGVIIPAKTLFVWNGVSGRDVSD